MRTLKTHPWSTINILVAAFNFAIAIALGSLVNLAVGVGVSLVAAWMWRMESQTAEIRRRTDEINAETAELLARLARRQGGGPR